MKSCKTTSINKGNNFTQHKIVFKDLHITMTKIIEKILSIREKNNVKGTYDGEVQSLEREKVKIDTHLLAAIFNQIHRFNFIINFLQC